DYIVEGTSYPLGAHDIALVRAGEIHRPVIDGKNPYERIVIYIAPAFLSRVSRPERISRHASSARRAKPG
ncbi:MAG: AraC family transcriptional regulator, partial [Schwartzia sp.]|nr:AraC family transcriptional regulator [Schwartzia sp. (in: firmicutes)]